jgi:hypothetical protein
MTTRSGRFRAWCAQAWRYVLLTSQALAGCDLTGQLTGWETVQDPVVPAGWAHGAPGVDEPRAIMTEVTQQAMTERLRGFTPAELAHLRVLRDRYQATRTRFTTRELAHLRFMRWLHQTGHVVR